MNEKATVGAVAGGLNPETSLPTEAKRLLQRLGKDPAKTWYRCLLPDQGPIRHLNGTDLQGFDLATLEADNRAGASIYFITGDADQATGKNKNGKPTGAVEDHDVHACRALFVEWDGKPIEWQSRAWRELGLPEPSAMVKTGGKSVHCYWALTEPLSPDEWRVGTQRLIKHCDSDKQCSNPSRLMRLPGFDYIDKKTGKPNGQRAELIHDTGTRYTLQQILDCLPEPEPQLLNVKQSGPFASSARKAAAELPPRPESSVIDALQQVPEFKHDQGRRDELLGLALRLSVELGTERAHELMAQHSPTVTDLAGYFRKGPDRISPGSLYPFLREHYGIDIQRHDLKRDLRPAGRQNDAGGIVNGFDDQSPPPASFQALIQLLPDGWSEKGNHQTLTPGQLAEMLPLNWLRFNELDLRAEIQARSGWQRITDACLDSAYVLLTAKGWSITAEPVVKAVLHAARQCPHHPVRDYLEQIEVNPSITPFDLDRVGPRFFRATNPLHVEMIRKWLIGAVARALHPGCQMDYCLVLQGGQGQQKSRSLEALASKAWHCCSVPENEKDLLLNVHSTWIYELAELESITNRKESGRLKNLITTSIDNMRPPYGRTAERLPRQSVFAATVNEDTFLRDDTGNRRYWVVPVEGAGPLDRAGITAARDSIWKAAVIAYRSGELPMLSTAMETLSATQNEDFNQQDPWVEMVRAWMDGEPLARWDRDRDPSPLRYDPEQPFTSAEVLYSAGLRRPDQIQRYDENRISAVLKKMGFQKRKQERVGGRKVRRWELSQPPQPPQPQGAGVVTPQTDCTETGLSTLSQPPQPISGKREEVEESATGGAGEHTNQVFSEGGCGTPLHPPKSIEAQSVSVSQPPLEEVVTPEGVKTPQRKKRGQHRKKGQASAPFDRRTYESTFL